MFLGFHFPRLNLFDAPKKELKAPYESEEDFVKWQKYSDYDLRRRFKEFAYEVTKFGTMVACILVVWRLLVDNQARILVTDLILQNIVGLAYLLITIIGIKITNRE